MVNWKEQLIKGAMIQLQDFKQNFNTNFCILEPQKLWKIINFYNSEIIFLLTLLRSKGNQNQAAICLLHFKAVKYFS
jgi:predicted transcriptional regulator